jgi:hypothetical protein
MRIVTAADDRYFTYLIKQIRGCREHLWNISPDVYDLGMTDDQKYVLKSMQIEIYNRPWEPEPGEGYPGSYYPRALHKPFMLYDYCEQYENEHVVYMDADAWPASFFTFPCVGLGLTLVSEKKMKAFKNTGMIEYVGPYHSGVIFLGASPDRREFLRRWATDVAFDKLPSDKKSLNRVIENENFTPLDTDIWNSRTMFPYTKIFHSHGMR